LIRNTNTIAEVESEQVESAPVPTPAQANPKKKRNLFFLLGIVVLLIGLGAGYFFVIRPSSETPSKPTPRPAIARVKPTKLIPETQKAQAQPVDSTNAGINMTVVEQGQKDSTIALQKTIIENKVAKETKKNEAQKGYQNNEEAKETKEAKLVNDKKENNSPVKEESVVDTPRRVSQEAKGVIESSIPSLGLKTENESPTTGIWAKNDSLKRQQPIAENTPSKELASVPELDSKREYFRKVLKVAEKSDSRAQVYYDKAVSYQQKRKLDQAIAFYKKALVFNPDHQQARIKLASVLMQTGRFEESRALLAPLYAQNPQDQQILFNLGLISYKLGQYPDAQDKIQQLLNINPLHLEAYLLLASIYEEKGEMKKAVEFYGQAHSIDINDPSAIYNLARTLDLSGDKVKAVKYYQLYLTGNIEKDDELELAVRKRLNFLLLQLGEK